MSWRSDLRGDALSWLLSSDVPAVRYLALRDLAGCSGSDPELMAAREAAHREGPIAAVLNEMDPAGFWVQPGPGYNPKYRSTVWAIILLAQLGAEVGQDARIARACNYLLDHALAEGGQFTASGGPGGTVDCLQGNLLWALLQLGCDDPRLATAVDWTARTVTGEGIGPLGDKSTPQRYYAGKCGPDFACGANNGRPCVWGATKVLLALAGWPVERRTPSIEAAIQRGVGFAFSVDPADGAYPTAEGQPPNRAWWKLGFPVFYVTDLLQLAEALARLGYGQDPRMARTLAFIRAQQDEQGRWALQYDYAGKTWIDVGPKRQPNPWVTLRALRVLRLAATR